jgi:hypothetical protein
MSTDAGAILKETEKLSTVSNRSWPLKRTSCWMLDEPRRSVAEQTQPEGPFLRID